MEKIICLPHSDGIGPDYIADRFPDVGAEVEVLCVIGGKSHVVPYLCGWSGDDWVIAGTGRLFDFKVVGWRASKSDLERRMSSRRLEGRGRRATLSNSEIAVTELVAEGLLNKEIGYRLGIREGTVKAHVSQAIKRLDLKNRVQLAVWFVQHGRRELKKSASHTRLDP